MAVNGSGAASGAAAPVTVPAGAALDIHSHAMPLPLLQRLETAGLADLGKPEGYARRQVEGWSERWVKAKTEEVPDIDALAAWLRERVPAESDATLVHNDFKFDNVVLAEDDPTRIVAVLDWEMCTLGDPLMDLGTTIGYWAEAGDDPAWKAMAFGPTSQAGAMTRRELVERYVERTGRDAADMLFYYAFALLKIAVIVQQIHYRWKRGFTKDPRFATLDEVVRVLGRSALAAIARGARKSNSGCASTGSTATGLSRSGVTVSTSSA